MSESITSGGLIDAAPTGSTIWLTDCIGGDLTSIRVWTSSETLWELRPTDRTHVTLESGTYGLTYGEVPSGFVEMAPAVSLPTEEFVLVNWTFIDQSRELPPGFGANLSDTSDREAIEDSFETICGRPPSQTPQLLPVSGSED